MTTTSAVVTMGALVGNLLAVDKTLTTLPIALQFVSTMATTLPASFYMRRFGRRVGFTTGALIGVLGALINTYAIFAGDFVLFCLGSMCLGSFSSFAQYFRFAAAEVADMDYRSRAISLVLAGGVVAALTGPNLALLTMDLFSPVLYAGTYISLVSVYILVIVAAAFTRIPRPTAAQRAGHCRPIGELMRQPTFVVAVLAATSAYAAMSLLMTVTPLAMAECDFTFADSALVIQGHILGMFLPSFFTGHLIARFGVLNVMLAGALILVGCITLSLSGVQFAHFIVSLTLLGIGWNFMFVGGTTLLTQVHTEAEKAKVQGLNDFLVWGSVTVGVFASGALQTSLGWTYVNLGCLPLILLALGLTLWLRFGQETLKPA